MGGCFSSLFSVLWLPGLPAPDPGNFLYAQKVTKKAQGDPDPFFLQSDAPKIGYPVATEFLQGRWPLVIGAVRIGLRLTALGMRVVSFWLAELGAFSITVGEPTQKPKFACPFEPVGPYPLAPPVADINEGRATAETGQEARRRSDAKGQKFSGNELSKLIQTDWAKAGVQPEGGWRFFGSLLGVQK